MKSIVWIMFVFFLIQPAFTSSQTEGELIKVIIELKQEPLIQAEKRLAGEPPYPNAFLETSAKILGIYDEGRRFKNHKEDVIKEHAKVKAKIKKPVKREYHHLFNGFAVEVTASEYAELLKDNRIKTIWEDGVIETLATTNAQLNDTVAEIRADELWSTLDDNGDNVTGQGVNIAILDTGILYNHTDFGSCQADWINETGNCTKISFMHDFVNDDTDALDDNSHGTHVAGIASANGTVKGVAPDSTLLIYKVCNSLGTCANSDVLTAIENATLRNADIVSLSLGGIGYSNSVYTSTVDGAMANGTLVVISAGNDNNRFTVTAPGATLSALTVGASCLGFQDGEDSCTDSASPKVATFSSKGYALWSNLSISGLKPDLLAPGVRVNSTGHSGPDEYAIKSGTSMAAPHASGSAALIKQINPSFTSYELKSTLVNYAKSFGYEVTDEGSGIVDLVSASNRSLTIQRTADRTNLIFLGSNLNTSVTTIETAIELNVTNRWTSSLSVNLSAVSETGITFSDGFADETSIEVNESVTVTINLTLNNSQLNTGNRNGTFQFLTNNSEMINVTWGLFTIDNDQRCPSEGELTADLTLPSGLTCYLPDWGRDGAIQVSDSGIDLDCNGSTLHGINSIDATLTVQGNTGVEMTGDSTANKTVRQCRFTEYEHGIIANGGRTADGDIRIEGNIFDNTTQALFISTVRNVTIVNNSFLRSSDEAINTIGANAITITDNNITGVGLWGIRFISGTVNSTISRNVINGSIDPTSGTPTGFIAGSDDDSTVLRNNVVADVRWGVLCTIAATPASYTFQDTEFILAHDNSLLTASLPVSCNIRFINVTFTEPFSISSNSTFTNEYYLTVNVTDGDSTAIEDAEVSVYDDNGTLEWSSTTNSDGQVLLQPTIDFWRNNTHLRNHTSVNVTVSKSGHDPSEQTVSMDTNKEISFNLVFIGFPAEGISLPGTTPIILKSNSKLDLRSQRQT